jgi:hypothetical protein
MANTKKRRRPPARSTSAAPAGGASPERRERRERARLAREAERKREQRRAFARRATLFAGVGLVSLAVLYWFQRADSVRALPAAAVQAAEAAGCTGITTPVSGTPDRSHLAPGASYTYSQHPATSGPHDPAPLPIPPHVYPAPIPETKAVHNLEHGAVIMYYRASGDGALSRGIVARLAVIANHSNDTILAPYPDLPSGRSLALAAWNKLQTCPAGVTGPQARMISLGFIHAYACTSNAPEARLGQGC